MKLTKHERDKLLLENLKLIYKIINKYFPTGDFNEYVNQGIISFIKAIEKFDPTKNVKLTTFAYRVIKNDLMDYTMKNRVVAAPVSRKNIPKTYFESDIEPELRDAIFQHESDAFFEAAKDELLRKIETRLASSEARAFKMLLNGKTFKEIYKATGVTKKKMRRLVAILQD